MIEIIQSCTSELDALVTDNHLKYVDEDWGQLDDYSPNFPVKWPCALINVEAAEYSNIGRNNQGIPANKQIADYRMIVTVANMKLSNSSSKAPQSQKDKAWSIYNLLDLVHEKLQGHTPSEHYGPLIRTGMRRIRRDDGVQEYQMIYSGTAYNV